MSCKLCAIHRTMWRAIQEQDVNHPLFFAALQNISQVDYFIDQIYESEPRELKKAMGGEVEKWMNMTGLKN